MKKYIYILLTICFLVLWSSCRKDFEFSASTGSLEFSRDTVYLDTIFTNIGSSTYNLKVYNRSNDDILIPTVRLGLGDASQYRLSVDGLTGKTFEDIELLANDSLFIFIETTVDINNFPNPDGEYLYTDQIEFDSGGNLQEVELVTLIKDATFIFPDRDNTTKIQETINLGTEDDPVRAVGRELMNDELIFTKEKPYVIYGFAAVPEGQTLTIEAGARLHFHENSGIIVQSGASINVNGALSTDQELLENEVIFEGDRLEPNFSERPGQWATIWLLDGSVNNTFNYATIKNAIVGILCDGDANATDDKLTITNSQIYNSGSFGILGRNTSITGENVVLNNAGQSVLAVTLGGKYNFTHSTITNYWQNGPRPLPALLINNFLRVLDENENEVEVIADLSEANFNNCIIYGNDNPEFLVDQSEEQTVDFNFKFTNCLVRFDDRNDNFTGPNFDFENMGLYENVIFNEEPNFLEPNENMLIIGDDSAANGQGNTTFANQVPTDILNVNRTASPDIGAYQHITFPEED
ncbi:hypothetical protein SAMN05421824_1565 [Hyunsoonleella jejuensis]|uniref:Right handed beta helix region n=1 Tax=Hyunsoonleella jejuensis TaxID=419940 RepID=A0A1H9FSW4_9FLAO|nr:hypothetical protein [Hyunsoonleella jejuensis]SEQ40994.1 hypothetical protein SAMN05421824_1565 [Hyunsoonleella jejuensis]